MGITVVGDQQTGQDFAISSVVSATLPTTTILPIGSIGPNLVASNVPEPISYFGRSYIQIPILTTTPNENVFKTGIAVNPVPTNSREAISPSTDLTELVSQLDGVSSPTPIGDLTAPEIASRIAAGEEFTVVNSLGGGKEVYFKPSVKSPSEATPKKAPIDPDTPVDPPRTPNATPSGRLMLVEVYQLSSFLGQYGKGRTLKTFSLFPGERTRISIYTYQRRQSTAVRASSIFDSYTLESANEFLSSLESERTNSSAYQQNSAYRASASAGLSWGVFGSASASASAERSTSVARQQLARDITTASRRHANQASTRRDVQINTSSEVVDETGEETAVVREVANINVSKTLNFVFRQMNQEIISLLHLTDVKIAYSDGSTNSYREVPLTELDRLLEEVVKDGTITINSGTTINARQHAKNQVLAGINSLRNYNGVAVTDFIEKRKSNGDLETSANEPAYYTVSRRVHEYNHSYQLDEAGNVSQVMKFQVPGVIISVDRHVLRTDAVMVQAFVLENETALDKYSYLLQEQSNRELRLKNDLLQLAYTTVQSGDAAAAERFVKVVSALGLNNPPVSSAPIP